MDVKRSSARSLEPYEATPKRNITALKVPPFRFHRVALNAMLTCIALAVNTTCTQAKEDPTATASLPMYEVSESVKKADDIFWSHLQAKLKSEGISGPVSLARTSGELIDQWEQPDLLLSQACGYPYVHTLMDKGVKIVGTPIYATNSNLPAGEYRSVIVVNSATPYKTLADLKGKRAGVNDWTSNSGMNLFRAAVAETFPEDVLRQGVFSSVTVTDGHLKSVRMIAADQIDVASIDDVSYDLIRRNYPDLASKTRILAVTPAAPGLPMITSTQTDDATLQMMRTAIKDLVEHPDDEALREALATMKLTGFAVIDKQEYVDRVHQLEDLARNKGYPTLK
ncbi:phosphate/phosphite/phosphonate ABC transporter substrate-binding protein [Tunturiibacter psychrotolerans]|uniref:phosphate/phosphite/phosphonate ABC transporter substrate-binding protein n=1 Tax=Tunturiibacter psychrotolerans TaxID=3069686 RepID=UPI003D1CEDDF